MDAQLHEAALMGDVDSLRELHGKDGQVLDKADAIAETPLHIAVLHGHHNFVKEILTMKPELACKLDTDGFSPLHLASRKGDIPMVKQLLEINPDMCVARDKNGMTPLHTAALKGRLGVMGDLVQAKPIAARILTRNRKPILHLCMDHNRLDSVKWLLEHVRNDDFVSMKDDDDNTILHLSVNMKHLLLTKFLLSKTNMRAAVNAKNVEGFTALDILRQNPNELADAQLKRILRKSGAVKAKSLTDSNVDWRPIPSLPSARKRNWKKHVDWLNEQRSAVIVVAVLIATVTFQAGLNPPGGLWQDDKENNVTVPYAKQSVHIAGQSIMADKQREYYIAFTVFNVTAFVASLLVIFLLISGFTFKGRFFTWMLTTITWITLSSMLLIYAYSFFAISPDEVLGRVSVFISGLIIVGCLALIALICATHFLHFLIKQIRIRCWSKSWQPPVVTIRRDVESPVQQQHGV